jgi:glycosyltransferase involved in cell wall biosynthesis
MISNGVDIKVFERKEPGYFDEIRKGTENIVLGVANFWTEEKGVHQFFELARLLGDGYKIMLVGKREKEFSDIPNNIHFIGSIGSKEQLAHAYSDADVFVHLAIEETFGLVIAEAACCGLYTIGYQSTGIAEVLKRAQGSLVRANDVNNVKTEVVRVCSAKLRLTGDDLETVRRDFSQENMIEKYIALYSEILSSDNEKVKK